MPYNAAFMKTTPETGDGSNTDKSSVNEDGPNERASIVSDVIVEMLFIIGKFPFTQCCFNAGPVSQTEQHLNKIGWTSRAPWVFDGNNH